MHPIRRLLVPVLLMLGLPAAFAATDPLAAGFRHPPASARPQTWWHWMNGNISRVGIKADLEAMHRIGLGGAQIFNAAQHEAPGPVKVLSPEWFSLMQYAIEQAHRLGLQITVHNSFGWSESGGPWVTPPQAMQRVVWSELRVHGPEKLETALPEPTMIVANYCSDIAVLAFPALPGDTRSVPSLHPTVTSSTPGVDLRPLLGGNGGAVAELPMPTATAPEVITIGFAAPRTFGSVRLVGREYLSMPMRGRIEASDDGVTFRRLADLPKLAKGRNHPSVLTPFPLTTAKYFRIVITKVDARAKALVLTAISLGGDRLAATEELAGFRAAAGVSFPPEQIPAADAIAPGRIVNLTAHVKNGRLEWNVPPGDWTILRFCHTLTGQMNAPAPAGGRGWECDKMSRAAVDAHFNALMGRLIRNAGPLAGTTFTGVLADSWEAGSQNWTPAFRADFIRLRGYDPLPYLPVITGRVVGSVGVSQRFLWDYRQTIGDLIAQNYYGEFEHLAAEHHMHFQAEAPGIGMPTIADELECKGRTDIPMGEFWMSGRNDTKETASAAHIYGKRLASAESFTAKPQNAAWRKAPFDFKMLGDLEFTVGINEFVFHRYAHQPWLNRYPGMAMGPWGSNFDRTNTWWNQARAWMQYLTRCQYLLQSGIPVSDVCYFYGENIPNTLANNEPVLPAGYDYDACNTEVLMKRMSVRDGRLVLPNGVSYAVLLLHPSDRMTPDLLAKIRDLVAAGATVVGPRPERSPSLVDYPRCDAEVRRIGAELWGDCDGVHVTEHRYGRGRVIWGRPIGEVLREAGLAPDFTAQGDGRFAAIHRRIGNADVYFVSSQNPTATSARLTFRITGRVPELWHPGSGRIERVARFQVSHGRTTIPVDFDPAGSVFVVFRRPIGATDPVVGVTRNGRPVGSGIDLTLARHGLRLATDEPGEYVLTTASGRTHRVVVPAPEPPLGLHGPWDLRFPAAWGAPPRVSLPHLISWTQSSDQGVKYFSGTATYRKDFDLPAAFFGRGKSVWLNLGDVKILAEVKLNGREIGILWKPPFRADITAAAHPGRNTLEVRVTNLWPNRMIGDQHLPPAKRYTWSTYEPYTADSPLLPSGLLGPVRISGSETVSVP